jgi:hypothetical protein
MCRHSQCREDVSSHPSSLIAVPWLHFTSKGPVTAINGKTVHPNMELKATGIEGAGGGVNRMRICIDLLQGPDAAHRLNSLFYSDFNVLRTN